jgi:hypothetical protein
MRPGIVFGLASCRFGAPNGPGRRESVPLLFGFATCGFRS